MFGNLNIILLKCKLKELRTETEALSEHCPPGASVP